MLEILIRELGDVNMYHKFPIALVLIRNTKRFCVHCRNVSKAKDFSLVNQDAKRKQLYDELVLSEDD